jgi:hypothetical protein
MPCQVLKVREFLSSYRVINSPFGGTILFIMDIKKIIKEYSESNEKDKLLILEKVKSEFSSLSQKDQDEVKTIFLNSLDEKLIEAKKTLDKVDIFIEISEISKYVSLSTIAKEYFGKSKEWLYQRIHGYAINGNPARFTDEERRILADALTDISIRIKETSLKIV